MRRLFITTIGAGCFALAHAADCAPNFTSCQPAGAAKTALPSVGKDLAPLYGSLLSSIKGIHAKRNSDPAIDLLARDTPSICCADGTACLNLNTFDIPFCYDRFTTNFVLADGTSGTLDSGSLSLINGPQIDLQQGSYTLDGISGNIYGGAPPNPSTLPTPTPYTSSGPDPAIPITDLAGLVTITTTVPGTTIPATTLSATTAALTIALTSGTAVLGAETRTTGGMLVTLDGETQVVGGSQVGVGGSTVVASGPTTVLVRSTVEAKTLSGTTVEPRTETLTTSIPSGTGGAGTRTGTGTGTGTGTRNAAVGPTGLGVGLVGVAVAFAVAF
ncbi:MAG: hypothetical protein MMC23_001116 [Stictis urceolatum]|nr:hypothetical protein [Stictis urceolata]